jgi:hypothetical protein
LILLKLNESTAARRRIPFVALSDTDGKTPQTGLTFAASDIKIAKDAATEASSTGTVTEVAGGVYYYELASGEVDTRGFLSIRIVKSGMRTFFGVAQVIDLDPYSATIAVSAGGIAASSFAAGAIDAAAIAASGGQDIADEVLNRNIAGGGSGGARIVRDALRLLRNRRQESGGTLTVYAEDDATPAWTASSTRSAGLDTLTQVDPV